jgi:hypothetical protein
MEECAMNETSKEEMLWKLAEALKQGRDRAREVYADVRRQDTSVAMGKD